MGFLKRGRNHRRLERGYLDVFAEVAAHEATVTGDVGNVCPTLATADAKHVLEIEYAMNPMLREEKLTRDGAAAATRCVTWWLVESGETLITGDAGRGRTHADRYVPLPDAVRARFLLNGNTPDVDECYYRVLELLGAPVLATIERDRHDSLGSHPALWRAWIGDALNTIAATGGGSDPASNVRCNRHPPRAD